MAVSRLDEQGQEIAFIATPDYIHSVCPIPGSSRSFCLTKASSSAFVVDWQDPFRVQTLQAAAGFAFSGHAALLPEQGALLASETHIEGREGLISVWDIATFKRIEAFPCGGVFPHELAVLSRGASLLIANAEGRSELSLIDLKTLKKHHALVAADGLQFRHFALTDRGDVFVGCRLDPAKRALTQSVARLAIGGLASSEISELRFEPPSLAEEYTASQFLSIAYAPSSDIAAATCPTLRLVVLVDVKRRALLRTFRLQGEPNGVALVGASRFVVTCSNGEMLSLDATMSEALSLSRGPKAIRFGSHLTAASS